MVRRQQPGVAEGAAGLLTRLLGAMLAAGLVTGLALVSPLPAAYAASDPEPTSPSATMTPGTVPVSWTPRVVDGAVLTITQVGDLVVLGGTFTKVSTSNSSATYDRDQLVAIDATTGAIQTGFAPTLTSSGDQVTQVRTVAPGPTPDTVLVGGTFNTVNGQNRRNLVLLNLTDGTIDPTFNPPALNGAVNSVVRAGDRYLIGGIFKNVGQQSRPGLASLDAVTGALDSYLTVALAEHHNWTENCTICASSGVGATSLALSPDGSQLAVIGNFRTADALARDQAVLISLGPDSAQVRTDWATDAFTPTCNVRYYDSPVRAVSFGPDGSYIVVASTGGVVDVDGTCDATARLEVDVTGQDVEPTWIANSGRDTFLSVAATTAAIYVGGHFRWLNNDYGADDAGPGAVPRPGIAALDPTSGRPLTWNPGRLPRGVGVTAFLVTDAGLWVGSDTDYVGSFRYYRPKIALLPFATGDPVSLGVTPSLPSGVALGGPLTGGDAFRFRLFDGTTVGEDLTGSSTVSWSKVDGAVRVDDWLYVVKNGTFYRAAFDGVTLGSLKVLDPYNDPFWCEITYDDLRKTLCGQVPDFYSELGDVTALAYADGRLYYAKNGSTTLRYRLFSPDSGVVDPTSHAVVGSLPAGAIGLLLDGTDLYVADRSGDLSRLTLTAAGLSGTPVTVSGPNVDGVDWAAHAVFLTGSDTIPVVSPPPTVPPPSPPATPPATAKAVIVHKATITATKLKKNGRLVVKWRAATVQDGTVTSYRVEKAKKKKSSPWSTIATVPGTAAHKAVWKKPKPGTKYRLRLTTLVPGSSAASTLKVKIPKSR